MTGYWEVTDVVNRRSHQLAPFVRQKSKSMRRFYANNDKPHDAPGLLTQPIDQKSLDKEPALGTVRILLAAGMRKWKIPF